MSIGKNIRSVRRAKGMSQKAFARELRVSQTVVCMWETDRHYPSLFMLICIADLLEVSLDELVGRGEEKK